MLRDDSWSAPGVCEECDRCISLMRTWYRDRAQRGSRKYLRRVYGPEEPCYMVYRRRRVRRHIRPSIASMPETPLPGPGTTEFQNFTTSLATEAMCKAAFAYAPRHRREHNRVLMHNVTFRGRSMAVMTLADAYRHRVIDRTFWAVEDRDWEHALIEDMVLFQIGRWPGMPTESVLRLNRSVSGLLTSMPPLVTQVALHAALLRLREADRIVEVRPNRWRESPAGHEPSAQLFHTWLGMTLAAPYGEENYKMRRRDVPF